MGRDHLHRLIEIQRTEYVNELAALHNLRRERLGSPVTELLIDAARLTAEANLRLLELVDERAESLLDDSAASPSSSAADETEARRRGR
jgi:hypothetical protein